MVFIRDLITAVFLMGGAMTSAAHAAEEPPHTVTFSAGSIEIREYEPLILAEVEVSGDMAAAGNRGFRPLANFIFGDNQKPGEASSADIAMTAPVIQSRSEKIAMTSPVTQERADEETWRVAFVMPADWSMETLPQPNDVRVQLRQVPARRMAAIRFSGGPSEKRFQKKANELSDFLSQEGYQIIGDPIYARYDPPWIPTFLRRNEVMIEISQ
jgi:effector-binding domain-containing protein